MSVLGTSEGQDCADTAMRKKTRVKRTAENKTLYKETKITTIELNFYMHQLHKLTVLLTSFQHA